METLGEPRIVNNQGKPHPGDTMTGRILILDDEPSIILVLARLLKANGYEVIEAQSIGQARAALISNPVDVAIIDVYLGEENGLEFATELRETLRGGTRVMVISAEDTESLARKATDAGADAFVSKPVSPTAVLHTLRRLLELRRERLRARALDKAAQFEVPEKQFPEILTQNESMRAVLRLVQKVGPRDLAVLVYGESGTGKELIARAIHHVSARPKGPFIELNCAALPPNLVESELFGHERGSFTGAVASHQGKIQQASGGTLFLDEIGELPLEIQPKLLRALQEKKIIPIGGKEPVSCDFRLVSATNRDLVEEVRSGRFREDLFYRVAVFPIKLPALRFRRDDLGLLLMHFLEQQGVESPQIDEEALALLRSHAWPGNVRELLNFAQAIILYTDDGRIDADSVRQYFGSRLELGAPAEDIGSPIGYSPETRRESDKRRAVLPLADVERAEIDYALDYFEGNVSEAARALGMGRATLYKYIKRHDIDLNAVG